MDPLLTVEEALAAVLERIIPLPAEPVALGAAAGRILAADAPGRLPVVGRIAAGRPAGRSLGAGEAMAIATGGVVPDGADAVIPVEDVVEAADEVEIPAAVEPSAHVRSRGGDVRAGAVVVAAGSRLGPAQVGALAAAGIADVSCASRPRAAVVTTGTELRLPGEPLRPGEVYEANGVMLAAALAGAGATVEQIASVADDSEAHRAALERGLEADVLVTSGGVSVGPHDLVRSVEAELGVEEVFWRVAVKPGKPISFGVRGRTLVFGLPGNPVSTLVTFELFVRPAVLALQGVSDPGPVFRIGTLAEARRRNAARDELVRARGLRYGDELRLEPLGGQESHMLVRAAGAPALVFVPRGEGELAAG